MNLHGSWVMITGGSSGIGFAIARHLVDVAARITLIAHDPETLENAAVRLRVGRAAVDVIPCDLADPSSIDRAAAAVVDGGRIPDVLINNAGFGTFTPFEAATMDEIDRLLAVNLTGHVRFTKHVLRGMIERRSGALCFMASIAGRVPITPNATYCSAKHGMVGLADALRTELQDFGIEVTAVCPGRVETAFFDHPTFRARTRGPETRSSIPVEAVARATCRAIEKNARLTYIPRTLGLASWAFEALPFVLRPMFDRIMRARMQRLYADAR